MGKEHRKQSRSMLTRDVDGKGPRVELAEFKLPSKFLPLAGLCYDWCAILPIHPIVLFILIVCAHCSPLLHFISLVLQLVRIQCPMHS